MPRARHRARLAASAAVLWLGLATGSAAADIPLPPPPALPPPTLPAAAAPLIAVTGPTLGPACGTASLLTLLAPSIAEGYLDIPLSSLIDSDTFRSYGNTALYVCGFIPFPLTPTQCQIDYQILDALRGLNPLAAQVVGLFPGGAAVDTVLAIEALLPTGPSVAGGLVDELSRLLQCTRSAGAPPLPPPATEPPPDTVAPAPEVPAPAPPFSSPLPTVTLGSGGNNGATPEPAATALPPTDPANELTGAPQVFQTVLHERSGVQWLGVLLGAAVLLGSVAAWLWARRQRGS